MDRKTWLAQNRPAFFQWKQRLSQQREVEYKRIMNAPISAAYRQLEAAYALIREGMQIKPRRD